MYDGEANSRNNIRKLKISKYSVFMSITINKLTVFCEAVSN